MALQKIIFFPDQLHEGTRDLFKQLNKEFRCAKSSRIDEFDQVYKQSGHFAIVFSDAEFGLNYLIAHANALSGLKFKTFVLHSHSERTNENPNPLMNTLKMSIYLKSEVSDILKSVRDYLTESPTNDLPKEN